MVPAFQAIGARWQLNPPITAKQFRENIITRFDLDLLVNLSDLGKHEFEDHRLAAPETLKIHENSEHPKNGVGWLEILRHIYNENWKYRSRTPLELCLPRLPSRHRLFWEILFGAASEDALGQLADVAETQRQEAIPSKLYDLLFVQDPNFLDLMRWGIREYDDRQMYKQFFFVFNPSSWPDLVHFWNMRAAGLSILPLPANYNYYPAYADLAALLQRRTQRKDSRPIVILRGFSLRDEEYEESFSELAKHGPIPIGSRENFWRVPPYWGPWSGREGDLTPPRLEATSEWQDLRVTKETPSLEAEVAVVGPAIPTLDSLKHIAFANELEVSLYGADLRLAAVLPSMNERATRRLNPYLYPGVRYSNNRIVLYCSRTNRNTTIGLPTSDAVICQWLETEHSLVATPSIGGKLASSMQARLDAFGLHALSSPHLAELLRRKAGKPTSISASTLKQVASRSVQEPTTPADWIRSLVDRKVLSLGLVLQCPSCQRNPWFPIPDLAYELRCTICHSTITLDQGEPPLTKQWAYRFLGPFDLEKESAGALTVLLTINLLSKINDHRDLTASPGLDVDFEGSPFELDLVVLLKHSSMRTLPELLIAECKAGSELEDKDIRRLISTAKRFPNATLIVATLSESLKDSSKSKLNRAVDRLERLHNSFGGRLVIFGKSDLTNQETTRFSLFGDGRMQQALDQLFWRNDWELLCVETQRRYLDRPLPTRTFP